MLQGQTCCALPVLVQEVDIRFSYSGDVDAAMSREGRCFVSCDFGPGDAEGAEGGKGLYLNTWHSVCIECYIRSSHKLHT